MKIGSLLPLITLVGCSSPPPPAREMPAWVNGPARTVDGGYIVFVGSGEDHSSDHAATKAEGAALQDLANECSLIPLGTRLEDRATKSEGALRTAYAKVAVEFEVCEEAKHARTPERVRQVANVAMTEQLKRYQDLVDEPTQVAVLDEGPPLPAAPTAGAPPPPRINDDFQYFVVRQQVAYEKQMVVLSPPTAFAPGSVESQQFAGRINASQPSLSSYEAAHPKPRASAATWTQYRSRAVSAQRMQRDSGHAGLRHVPNAPAARHVPAEHGSRGGRHHRGR